MYKKAWCTCKVVFLPYQAIPFFTFSSPQHLTLDIIYDTLRSVRNRIFSVQIESLLLIASETSFDSAVVPSFLFRKAGLKGATKVFKHGRKSPWVPTLTGPFPNGQENAGSSLGTKNALYYYAQSANSLSWVIFVSSYTTAIISPQLPCSFTGPTDCPWVSEDAPE